LIDRVSVGPAADRPDNRELELIGNLAVVVRLTQFGKADAGKAGSDLFDCSVNVVAETRNHLDLLLTG
jgi:hypothetical protein